MKKLILFLLLVAAISCHQQVKKDKSGVLLTISSNTISSTATATSISDSIFPAFSVGSTLYVSVPSMKKKIKHGVKSVRKSTLADEPLYFDTATLKDFTSISLYSSINLPKQWMVVQDSSGDQIMKVDTNGIITIKGDTLEVIKAIIKSHHIKLNQLYEK